MSEDLKNQVCEKALKAIRFGYDNRDKLIILVGMVTGLYYTIESVKAIIELHDKLKYKYTESCQNLEYITDYLTGVRFRCQHCNKKYRKHKCFVKHCYIHDFEKEMAIIR